MSSKNNLDPKYGRKALQKSNAKNSGKNSGKSSVTGKSIKTWQELLNRPVKPATPAELRHTLMTAHNNAREHLERAYALVQRGDMAGAEDAMRDVAHAVVRVENTGTRILEGLEKADRIAHDAEAERDEAVERANLVYDEAYEDGMTHYAECDMCANEARIEYIAQRMLETEDVESVVRELHHELDVMAREAEALFREEYLNTPDYPDEYTSDDEAPLEAEIYPNMEDDLAPWDDESLWDQNYVTRVIRSDPQD